MSIQPDALDRSVLESKKLDELQAIASAIGAKAGSRARKAQVVDAILAAAGVDDSPEASTTTATTTTSDSAADTPSTAAADSPAADGTADAAAAEATTTAAGNGTSRPPARKKPPRPSFSADPWADAADEQEKFRQKSERRSSGDAEQGSLSLDESPSAAAAENGAGSGNNGSETTTAEATANEAAVNEAAVNNGGADGSSDQGKQGGDAASADKGAEAKQGQNKGAEGRSDRGRGDQNKSDQSQGDQGKQGQNQGKGDQGKGGQNKGDQGKGGQNQGDQGKGDQGKGGQNQGGQDRNRNNDDQPEPGNRRRRRRGRDRDRDDNNNEPQGEPVEVSGLLDLRDEGYGFLRTKGYLPSRDDVYVSAKQVRQFSLRKGDLLTGMSRPANRNEKNPGLLRLDLVNGLAPDDAPKRPKFEDLTPLFPDEKLKLERPDDPGDMTARIIDLISPIGKGQRGLIVSPPKAGKTTIMKTIATAIEANNPEVHLMVLLVDERPEEVTDMRRTVRGEVVSSTFDRPSDEHTQVAELSIERAKRLAETGKDVVIILDGITRLARAYNLAAPATGRIMSGGVDSGALYPPKRFFGAARNLEEGGSLTILATALIETGSRMDEVIFEEFKGTGNMELRLDRRLAERRIYPAIDVDASSTRQEQLLFDRRQVPQVMKLRRVLSGLAGGPDEGRPGAGLELMVDRLKTFASNDEFLAEIARAPSGV